MKRSFILWRCARMSACFLAVFFCLPCGAYPVFSVADGDTLTLDTGGRHLKIRLANIDAPERGQAYGREARRSLAQLCLHRDAQYQAQDVDAYGRTVATVRCEGVDASRAQVERGLAWVPRHYNRDAALAVLQDQAKRQRIGLWADADPVPPWQFRHGEGSNPHAGPSTDGICHIGPRGGHFRWVNGRKRYGC